MKTCINYSSEEELYSILSKYINCEHMEIVKFIIHGNEITIHHTKNKIKKNVKIEKAFKVKEISKLKNDFKQPESVSKIYRAIKRLKRHNMSASRKNIARYLSMSIVGFSSLLNFYRTKGYKFNIDSNKLEHKSHPLYHKMYTVWRGMVQRCCNPNHDMYHRYGGRGILISDEWRYSPDQFFIDLHDTYIENSTLDRIDNDKGYSKENCRWADSLTQHRNTSKCLRLVYKNEEMHFNELIEKLQLYKYTNILRRKIKKFNSWDLYIANFGIRFKNKEFCCLQHLIDSLDISSDSIVQLMKRYYRNNKALPKPRLKNINYYIANCYNFSDNLINVSKNNKVLKKDLIGDKT